MPIRRLSPTVHQRFRPWIRSVLQLAPVARSARAWRQAPSWKRIGAVSVLGVLVTAMAAWGILSTNATPSRARPYLAFKSCLLTDSHGISGNQAALAWAAMEDVSVKTHAMAQYLPAFGPPTVGNTLPYLASLAQRRCDIVVTAGDVPGATAVANAGQFPNVRFIIIGGQESHGNITAISPQPPIMHAALASAITAALQRAT